MTENGANKTTQKRAGEEQEDRAGGKGGTGALQTDDVTGKVFFLPLLMNSFHFEEHEKATKGQRR